MSESTLPPHDDNVPHTDGTFEIKLRLLGNEVFAVSITADPLNKKWVAGAILISLLLVVGISLFGQPLAEFSRTLYGAQTPTYIESGK